MERESTIYWLAVYDTFDVSSEAWREWMEFGDSIFDLANLKMTHLAFKGETSKGKSVVPDGRHRKKLFSQLDQHSRIDWIAMYCLFDEFRQAVFDFHLMLERRSDQLVFAMDRDIVNRIGVPAFRQMVHSYHPLVTFFEADAARHETLMLVIGGVQSVSALKTINVLNDKRGP